MSDDNYKVYMHKFPDDKVYVGLTKQTLAERWGNKGHGYHKQPLYDAIQKFGWDNIEHILIADGLTQSEAQDKEKELINKYNAIDDGYNISNGGGCGGNPWCLFEYNGEMLTSDEIAKLSVDGITGHDITTRVRNRNWDLEKAITTPKHKKGEKYQYKGNWYTAAELAKISPVEGMTSGIIGNRIRKYGWSVERAVEQPKDIKLQPMGNNGFEYEYQGCKYKAYELAEMSPVKGMNVDIMSNRLLYGWDIDRALNQPIRKSNIKHIYHGKEYSAKELAEISPVNGITASIIRDRIRYGWTVEEAVEKPLQR